MSEAKPGLPDIIQELNVPARFEVAKDWALAAKQVAETTQDTEALKIWEFINSRTAIGVPMPEGGIHYFFTEKPERPVDEYAILTPIIEADIERLPEDDFRRQLAEGRHNVAAQYREGSHAIYLPPQNFGKLGRGILLQHEAVHAWLDLEKQIDREAKDSHWFEEADVFKFEFRLLGKLIGDPYTDLVSRVSETIAGSEDNPNALSASYELTDEDRKMIAEGLETSNDQEIDFWLNAVVKFDAFWQYFQKQFDNPNAEFTQFLKAMYAHKSPSSDLLPN
ncbi:MAG TPA: hypothetical protein VJ836_02390 [Candidatus Saccharimonadales bacterium]|nr:hypothetical protein [Candidatus Saccharimonadales bacterium]